MHELMNFEERLIEIIEHAGSPANALQDAAAAIAQDELSETCGVFLAAPEGTLTLWARSGDGFTGTREQAESLSREALTRVSAATSKYAGHVMIAAPLGALVVARSASQPYAQAEVRRLVAIASHIAGVIEGARMIEMLEPAVRPQPSPIQAARGERVLQGIAASPGAAIGKCVFRQTFPRSLLHLDVARGPAAERARATPWR